MKSQNQLISKYLSPDIEEQKLLQKARKTKRSLIARMKAENTPDTTEESILNALNPCVAGNILVKHAFCLKRNGELKDEEVLNNDG